MKKIIYNISNIAVVENEVSSKPVCGSAMQNVNYLENAYIIIENDKIHSFGSMNDINHLMENNNFSEKIDANGGFALPGFCDSHTHIVFAGSREAEFVDKIKGLSYEDIAKRGGGILNSAERLQKTSEDELFESAKKRVIEVITHGTTALEIKSGYGLTPESELKMLRVIKRIKEHFPIPIKSTFLGAHAFPLKYKNDRQLYIDEINNVMLPEIAKNNLADYVDVFCDEGFFTLEETASLLEAASKFGLKPKMHANEMANSGGVQLGIKYNAVSVDHLERIEKPEIDALLKSNTMPTALPGASFFLKIPFAPMRQMVDAGLPLVLASDFNPGSSPSGNMQFVMSLACIYGRLLPEEALHALTLNGAFAMELQSQVGSICVGKKANIIITQPIPSLAFMPYYYGFNKISKVIIAGSVFNASEY